MNEKINKIEILQNFYIKVKLHESLKDDMGLSNLYKINENGYISFWNESNLNR